MAVALVYNWWSVFVRLAHPKARLGSHHGTPTVALGHWRTHAPWWTNPFGDHADARSGGVCEGTADPSQSATERMATYCGAIENGKRVAAGVRVHRHRRHRI